MNIDRATLKTIRKDRDVIAALLSVVPGLGHIYKGYYAVGAFTLLLGVPIVIWIGLLLSLATAGVGMLIPLACWAAVTFNAYFARDRRRHHYLGVV